jgi:hypothetical protein
MTHVLVRWFWQEGRRIPGRAAPDRPAQTRAAATEGFFWNADPAGSCGYRTTALLRIERGGKSLYQAPFEAHCSESKDIVTNVSVRSDGSVVVAHTRPRISSIVLQPSTHPNAEPGTVSPRSHRPRSWRPESLPRGRRWRLRPTDPHRRSRRRRMIAIGIRMPIVAAHASLQSTVTPCALERHG